MLRRTRPPDENEKGGLRTLGRSKSNAVRGRAARDRPQLERRLGLAQNAAWQVARHGMLDDREPRVQ